MWFHQVALKALILYTCPTGAFTEYITRAPIGPVLPAGTVAQRFGRDLLDAVLNLLSNPSRGRCLMD